MKLFEKIDELSEKYLKVWEDVGNLESPTEFKEGVDAVSAYFAKKAQELAFSVEKFPVKESGDIITIVANPDVDARPISFSAHIDTVHPVGSFGTPAVKIEGDKIYGPGVMDCKGGGVAALMAMEALCACGYKDRPLILILQSDEECNSSQSGKKTIKHILERTKDSEAFINCESSRKGTLVLGRKGIIRYSCKVIGKGAHASRCYEGASAIREAAYKIIELEKFKDEKGITCNCGKISGGKASNSVAEECVFTAEFRFNTMKELDFIRQKTLEICQKSYISGTFCTLSEIGLRPAMEFCDRNMALFDKINKIFAKNGIEKHTVRTSLGGSDAADATCAKIPCVDSIAVEGDFIHTVNEYALIPSLAQSAKRLACIAWDFDKV